MNGKWGQSWKHSVNAISMSTALPADFIPNIKKKGNSQEWGTYPSVHTHQRTFTQRLKMTKFFPKHFKNYSGILEYPLENKWE